jgi:hypothetical protein
VNDLKEMLPLYKLWTVAIHEAGHAVAAHIAGVCIHEAVANGQKSYVDFGADSPVDRMVIHLAGPSADVIHGAIHIVCGGGTPQPRSVDVRALAEQSPILADRWQHDLRGLDDDVDAVAESMGVDTQTAWRHLQSYTTRLVRTRRRAIERVARLLVAAEGKVVQGSDVHAACARIGQRDILLDMARKVAA